jgi:site-specific DNA-methyltransferase (adenine-specific)
LKRSQSDTAAAAGLTRSSVQALEQGQGNLSTLERVLTVLDLTLAARHAGGPDLRAALVGLRQRHGLSQRAIARLLDLRRGTVASFETGAGDCRLETLAAYAAAVGAGLTIAPKGAALPFYSAAGNASVFHGWETPPALFDKVEAAVGPFDLDPCSPDKPGSVRTKIRFTAADDGLSREWRGRVFVNPPYGRELRQWVAKAALSAEQGALVVALIPARTDTHWWHDFIAWKATIFFLRGRLAFGDGTQSAPFPSAITVWGADPDHIARLAEALGVQPVLAGEAAA